MDISRRELLRASAALPVGSVLLASDIAGAASEGAWSNPRADAGNTASTTAAAPVSSLSRAWTANSGSVGNPIVHDGTVYVADSSTVAAVDAEGGSVEWRFDAGRRIGSAPATDGDKVYVTAGAATYGIDAESGEQEWEHRGSGGAAASPKVLGRDLYVAKGNSLYSLGVSTGAEVWSYSTGAPVSGPPAVHDGDVYVANEEGEIHAVEDQGNTESPRWVIKTVEGIVGGPVVTDDAVFSVGSRGTVRSFDHSGNPRWATGDQQTKSVLEAVSSPPAVDDDYVYVPTDDGNLHALRTSSGFEDWVYEGQEGSATAPAVAGGVVYLGIGGVVFGLDPSNGSVIARYESGAVGPPSISEGTVYVGGSARLYALQGRDPQADVSITSVSLTDDTVAPREDTSVTVSLTNSGGFDASIELTVTADDQEIASREVEVPAGGSVQTEVSASILYEGDYEVEVNGRPAGRVTVSEAGSSGDTNPSGGGDDGNDTDANTTQGSGNGSDDAGGGSGGDDGKVVPEDATSIPLPGFGFAAASAAVASVAAYLYPLSDEEGDG